MKKRTFAIVAAAMALATPELFAQSQAATEERIQFQQRERTQTQEPMREPIYGAEMMTELERNRYRERMRAASTDQERAQVRAEHHRQMQQRAKDRGVALPDEPPAQPGQWGGGAARGGGYGGGRVPQR